MFACVQMLKSTRFYHCHPAVLLRCKDQVARQKTQNIRCEISRIGAFIIRTQLRWVGHVHSMPNIRTSETVFYSLQRQLQFHGGQLQRYKDNLNTYMQSTVIDPGTWQNLDSNISKWWEACFICAQRQL